MNVVVSSLSVHAHTHAHTGNLKGTHPFLFYIYIRTVLDYTMQDKQLLTTLNIQSCNRELREMRGFYDQISLHK